MININQNGTTVMVDNKKVFVDGVEYENPTGKEQNVVIQGGRIFIGQYEFVDGEFIKKPMSSTFIGKLASLLWI